MITTVSAWDELSRGVQTDVLAGAADHFARLSWNRDQIRAAQRRGLARLLGHAVEHSAFHARRLRGVDIDSIDLDHMSALPVMTKADMMAELDDVFTDRRLRRSDIESALSQTHAEPVALQDEYIALASGGSSGTRGVFVFDREALAGFTSAVLRPAPSAAPPPQGAVYAAVAAPSAVHATGMLAALAAGDDSLGRYHLVSATRPLGAIVDELNAMRPTALTGYASMLARLAVEARAGRLQIHPVQVSPTSETLLPEMRAAIRDAFEAPIVDGFGSTEGLVGKTGPDSDIFAFNTDMCIVELVDAEYRPTPAGWPAAKVLVTNLYNTTQPLIRYELTDSFIEVADATGHGFLQARVQGRSDEVFRYPDGTAIHPIVIRSVVVSTPDVVDYQVTQTLCGVDISAITAADFDADEFTARLMRALAEAGLDGPVVRTRAVDRLDRNPGSGKFRRFVPL